MDSYQGCMAQPISKGFYPLVETMSRLLFHFATLNIYLMVFGLSVYRIFFYYLRRSHLKNYSVSINPPIKHFSEVICERKYI